MTKAMTNRYELVAVPGSAQDKSPPAIMAGGGGERVLIPVAFANDMHPESALAVLSDIQAAVWKALPELFGSHETEAAPAL